MRVLAGAGISVHRLKLELERVVEQLVAMLPKKRVEFTVPFEAPQDELLLAADDLAWAPALDGHRGLHREHFSSVRPEDHASDGLSIGRRQPIDFIGRQPDRCSSVPGW